MTIFSLPRLRIIPPGAIVILVLLSLSPAQGQQSVPQIDLAKANLPLSPIEQAEKDGTALRLSLKDLTRLALQNNLDIAISDTNEELFHQRIVQSHGPYDPALSVGLGYQSNKRPNTNLTNRSTRGDFNTTNLANWNFQFTQNIPTGGGIVGTYNSNRSDTNQQFALFSPQYTTSLNVQITQPLNRNRRIDQIRGAIRLANLDTKINDSQFKQTVSSTIANIQGMYWDLIGAIRDFTIKRDSVKLAQISLQNNIKEVEIGVQPNISITEARAEMANREVDMITSRNSIVVAENNLRAAIAPDRNAEIWQKVVVPTDTPDFRDYPVVLDQAIAAALQNRPELEQFGLQLEENTVNHRLGQNQKKWQFDLVASIGTAGVAGPQSVDPQTGQPLIVPSLIGGIGVANSTLFTGGFTNWFTGFNIQIPLRNRSLDAQLAQLQIQRQQVEMNRTNTEQKIMVQVRNSIEDLETNKQRVKTAQVALQLSSEQLDGETKRFMAGMSQNFLVLQRQQDLANAKGVELQALIAYNKSIINLQQAMYTLLESNDFQIAKATSHATAMPQFR
ncbi:MAG: TolC family protein [Acidobacteriia bacterium]|nr:TolC family protein [Terriglobia bacterium]